MYARYSFVFIFSIFSALAQAGSSRGIDCERKIPQDLVSELATSQPGLSLPNIDNLDADSVGQDIKAGGDGCYVVAKGAFTAEHQDSFALILKGKDARPVLAVASRRGGGWLIQHLPTFCDNIKYCYVKRGAPGTYVRSNALDPAPTNGPDRDEIHSEHDVIISGRLESTGVTYTYNSGKWLYVWTSD